MSKNIDYGTLMHKAMRTLIFDVLKDVEKNGLPGEHHFFITFDTTVEGVEISEWLRQRYPEEMTIVVQYEYYDLKINEHNFSIVLSFNNIKTNLKIDYNSIISFADPSANFGLILQKNKVQKKVNKKVEKKKSNKNNVINFSNYKKN